MSSAQERWGLGLPELGHRVWNGGRLLRVCRVHRRDWDHSAEWVVVLLPQRTYTKWRRALKRCPPGFPKPTPQEYSPRTVPMVDLQRQGRTGWRIRSEQIGLFS